MSPKIYKGSLLGTALLLLLAVSQFQRQLNQLRADPRLDLRRPASLGAAAPPMLEFTTVALGGFRGLIANALWIRASDLQLEGKYFEMVQLADWITKLEPTFVQVWLHQAWNMTYNISVKFNDAGDRWRWVQKGIELLRDEGLRYNPREALIYRELAWFFQHKMGQSLDDAHMIYKDAWAREMHALFGSGRPDYEELLNPKTDSAKHRVETLRTKYKMDPRIMKEVDDIYGPLEWRLPEAHAIYWATVGLKESRKKDLITLRRVIYQSMHMVVLRGRLIAYSTNSLPRFGPDLTKVERTSAAYERMIQDDHEMAHAIKSAYRIYLREIVYLLYTHHQVAEAQRWFKVVQEQFPDAIPPNLTLPQYALQRLAGDVKELSHDRLKALMEGLFIQYFFNLALDEDDRAEGLEMMARQLWDFTNGRIRDQKQRLSLVPYNEMKQAGLDRLLDPQGGLAPELIARLRTKLNLPVVAPPAPVPAGQKP